MYCGHWVHHSVFSILILLRQALGYGQRFEEEKNKENGFVETKKNGTKMVGIITAWRLFCHECSANVVTSNGTIELVDLNESWEFFLARTFHLHELKLWLVGFQ